MPAVRLLVALLSLLVTAAEPLPVVVCADHSNMVGKHLKPQAWCWDHAGAWIRKAAQPYAVNLDQLIKRARADFQAPDMVFIAGRITPNPATYPGPEAVHTAISTCALPRYDWIDLDDLTKLGDNVHYDTPGTVEMSRRFAQRFAELCAKP